ncbi:unnamed protein product [Mucor hiemalis]
MAITCGQFSELGQSDIVRARYLIQRYGTHAALGERSMSRRIVSLGVVQQLLRLNCCDPKADGDYWLFTRACEHNQVELCRLIIQSTLQQAYASKEASHLLNIATMKGAIPVIDLLVETFHVNIHSEVALALACTENQVETVRHLATKYGCDVHFHNEKYLRNACLYGYTTLVEYLLSEGSDVHAYSDSALQNAVYHGYTLVVKLLLDAGANASSNENKCLQHAITNGDMEIIKCLVTAGADPRFDNDWPLRTACELGLDDIVTYLIDVMLMREMEYS